MRFKFALKPLKMLSVARFMWRGRECVARAGAFILTKVALILASSGRIQKI